MQYSLARHLSVWYQGKVWFCDLLFPRVQNQSTSREYILASVVGILDDRVMSM